MVDKNKLHNVHVQGFQEDIESEIKKFDLFLLPSRREGLNVAIQESLSFGIPVVTTNVRGCQDLIINGYNGFIYDIKKAQEAVEAIKKIYMMNNTDYQLMSNNCYNYASENLNKKDLAKQIMGIFRRLC